MKDGYRYKTTPEARALDKKRKEQKRGAQTRFGSHEQARKYKQDTRGTTQASTPSVFIEVVSKDDYIAVLTLNRALVADLSSLKDTLSRLGK